MANYRTIRELKPYKGINLFRLHKNGEFYYYAFEDDNQITTRSLKELKRKVDERLEKKPHRIKMTLVRFICISHEFIVSDDKYNDIMENPMGDAEMNLLEKLHDMSEDDPIKYCNSDYMFEVDGEICEKFTDNFLEEVKGDVEDLMKYENGETV